MTSYVGAPHPFNASNDEWVLYIQRFEHFLLANKIENDNDRCHLLLALIGAPTYKLLSSLCAPKQPGELKFKDICDTLKKHFSPQPIKIAEHYRFYNRKQLEGESAAEYLAQLRQLANTCQFGTFLDEALCDRLVCGIRDLGMQRRLLAEADLTLKKAFQLIQGMEAAAKNAEEMQRENSTQQAAAATNVVHSTDPKAKKLSCSRCLGMGHNQAMCKYKTTKCNTCHKVGHLARACYRLQPRRQDQGVKGQHTGQSNKGHVRQVSDNPSEQVADIVTIYTVTEGLPHSYKVIMEVNKQPIEMELDTGAIVSEVTWTQQLHKPELKPCPFGVTIQT